jgi:serine/threonine-protein kinase RsbW
MDIRPSPEGSHGSLAHTLRAVPASVPELRRAVTTFAEGAGAGEDVLAALRLAVSEAVSNVVVHAYVEAEEPGAVRVTANVCGDSLCVTVSDQGRGMIPRPDSPGLGLGLPLIARTARSLEVRRGETGGTEMRMSFPLL